MNTYLFIICASWLMVLVLVVFGIKINSNAASEDERLAAIIPWMCAIGLTIVNVINGIIYFGIRMYLDT